MNNLRYCYNGDSCNNVINSNRFNYLSRDEYIRAENPRELYPRDFYSLTNLYSDYLYPARGSVPYNEIRSYRPGGCCTPEIYFKETSQKSSIVYRPYVRRVVRPLFYSQIPDYVIL